MKKYILILLCLITAFIAVAKPPKLNLDKLFDGSYDTNPSVSIQISQKDGKFFKGFTVRKNPSLVKTIWTLFKKDQAKGKDPLDLKGASAYSSFKIVNNNREIHVGITNDPSGECFLFIDGPVEAFK